MMFILFYYNIIRTKSSLSKRISFYKSMRELYAFDLLGKPGTAMTKSAESKGNAFAARLGFAW